MKIAQIDYSPYTLPFKKALHTAKASYELRQGIFIRVRSDDGFEGCGELAPLEDFSRETLSEAKENAWRVLAQLATCKVPERRQEMARMMQEFSSRPLPSVAWALEMMLAELGANAKGESVSKWLFADSENTVPVNGFLSGTREQMLNDSPSKCASGCSSLKLKIMPKDLEPQIETVERLSELAEGRVVFRLDCNQGLSFEQARVFLKRLSSLDCIEFVEEPIRRPEAKAIDALRGEFDIPIALDESLDRVELREEMFEMDSFDVMVIKPMSVGGITQSLSLAVYGAERAKKVVFTTTLESGWGIAACAHIASAFRGELLPCGFDTGSLFSEDVEKSPLRIEGGCIRLPQGVGYGVRLKPRQWIPAPMQKGEQ